MIEQYISSLPLEFIIYIAISAVVLLLGVFVMDIFWGVVSYKLRHKKGYNGGFLLGFFFGIFALAYNASLPNKNLLNKLDELNNKFDELNNNLKTQEIQVNPEKQAAIDKLFL
jgi:hypothetical protein